VAKITQRLNSKNSLSVLIGVCVVVLAVVPLSVPASQIGWPRWQLIIWLTVVVAVAGLYVQAILQSREDAKREEKEQERDARDTITHNYVKRIAENHGILDSEQSHSQTVVSKKRSTAFDSAANIPEAPSVYPAIKIVQTGFPKRTVISVANHGKAVAHKIQAFASGLPDLLFSQVETLAPSERKNIEITVSTSGVFFKYNLGVYLMKLWDASRSLASELPISMRLTYEDADQNKSETDFQLVYLPVRDILGQSQFEIRDVRIRRLPTTV
jgi:hypothetical protein